MSPFDASWPKGQRAFTLLELMVVVAIMCVLMVGGAALFRNMNSSQLTQAGQVIGDYITLARQEAVKRNKEVQVLFLDLDGTPGWEAIQLRIVNEAVTGPVSVPITKVNALPASIMISPGDNLSPLLSATTAVSGVIPDGLHANAPYKGFRFHPNGSLDQATTPATSFLTLQTRADRALVPVNYYTLQINPITGALQVYRP